MSVNNSDIMNRIIDRVMADGANPSKLIQIKNREQVMLVEHFIDADTCRAICEYGKQQPSIPATIIEANKAPDKKLSENVDMNSRSTSYINTNGINDLLRDIFYNAFKKHVEPFFDLEIESWEKPQLLHYTQGGKYLPHVDAEDLIKDTNGGSRFVRTHNRDVSVLLYLNEEFSGGALHFNELDFKIQPKAGLLVAFPSHSLFLHGAETTLSGNRYVLVTWAAAKGTPRIIPIKPVNSVFMCEFNRA